MLFQGNLEQESAVSLLLENLDCSYGTKGKKKKDAGQGRRPNNGLSTRQKISGILLGTTFGIVLFLDYSLPALLSSLFELFSFPAFVMTQ